MLLPPSPLSAQIARPQDELVDQCEQLVSGVAPQSLRDNDSLRRSLSGHLEQMQGSLDQLMVERPRRNILRRAKHSNLEG